MIYFKFTSFSVLLSLTYGLINSK